MGTIAARDCLRVLELTEQVVAALLITVRQGVALRRRVQPDAPLHASLEKMAQILAEDIAVIEEDRRLEPELRVLLQRMRDQSWDLYA